MSKNYIPIVIDNGSLMLKAGFGGDENPKAVFKNIVGRISMPKIIFEEELKELYIGDEVDSLINEDLYREKLFINQLRYPIERGIIMN